MRWLLCRICGLALPGLLALVLPACRPALEQGPASPPVAETARPAAATTAAEPSAAAEPQRVGETAGQWGTLKGRILFEGSAPAPAAVSITSDLEFCGKCDVVDESLLVGPDGGLANVVVTLYMARDDPRPPIHPSYESLADVAVSLDNRGCRFEPHICLLRTTQTLLIGNRDPVGHNTKIDAFSNPPINPLIPGGGRTEAHFPQPERVPVPISCSIHPWMKAYLVVREDPYMAVTDETGRFEIENLPSGNWTFQFWHEKAGYLSEVSRGGETLTWPRGRTEIAVAAGENDLGEIRLDPQLFAN